LIIYDFTSQQTNKINSLNLHNIHLLPDGCLLGVCAGKLHKHQIGAGQLVKLWTCNDIKGGYSLCTDSDRLIYVLAKSLKKLYVISPQGAVTNNTL